MRNKRGTLVLLIVLAVMVLGVGYAFNTIPLKINSTLSATTDNNNFNVEFSAVTESPATTVGSASAAIDTSNKRLATFTVSGFTTTGNTVTFTYTVKNMSTELQATVTAAALETFENSEYFDVAVAWQGKQTETHVSNVIPAGGTALLDVTVTCIKTPVADVAAKTQEGIITLTATASEAN